MKVDETAPAITTNAPSVVDIETFNSMLGPPPVWSTENAESYYKMLNQMLACLGARDFLEQLLIRDVAVITWEIVRLVRQKVLAVERKFRQHLELQAQKAKAEKERREILARSFVEKGTKPRSVAEQAVGLVEFVEQTTEEVAAILRRTPEEIDLARALEAGFDYYERLDRRIDDLMDRRKELLEQLGWYRSDLGQAAQRVSDQIIDAEFSEAKPADLATAPPLAPSGGDAA